jgi:hypothetical protein
VENQPINWNLLLVFDRHRNMRCGKLQVCAYVTRDSSGKVENGLVCVTVAW